MIDNPTAHLIVIAIAFFATIACLFNAWFVRKKRKEAGEAIARADARAGPQLRERIVNGVLYSTQGLDPLGRVGNSAGCRCYLYRSNNGSYFLVSEDRSEYPVRPISDEHAQDWILRNLPARKAAALLELYFEKKIPDA